MSNEHITDEQLHSAVKASQDPDTVIPFCNGCYILTPDELRRIVEALRPAAQPAVVPSKYGSPELQAMIVAHAAQPVGEPVATVVSWTNGSYSRNYKLEWHRDVPEGTKLYTTPQPVAVPDRVPMTDEQVDAKCLTIQGHLLSRRDRDRAVWRLSEAHHGITTPKADK